MAASRVLRNLVLMLREKGEVPENTQRQLRQKELKTLFILEGLELIRLLA